VTTASWQAIADQLTTSQIADLVARSEAQGSDREEQSDLLDLARVYSESNLNALVHFGHLALPDGAQEPIVASVDEQGEWVRYFIETSRTVVPDGDVDVTVHGMQYTDGHIRRYIGFSFPDMGVGDMGVVRLNMEPPLARQLAAALDVAAEEVDRLAD